MILALLQQAYNFQEARTIWEALRAWLNGEPIPGWRFTPAASNGMMLAATLIFIFLLELLLTIGIQIWERRALGRIHQRRGPQEYGRVTARAFRRIAWPVGILLAIPALCYGVEYWTTRWTQQDLPTLGFLFIIKALGIGVGIAGVIWLLWVLALARVSKQPGNRKLNPLWLLLWLLPISIIRNILVRYFPELTKLIRNLAVKHLPVVIAIIAVIVGAIVLWQYIAYCKHAFQREAAKTWTKLWALVLLGLGAGSVVCLYVGLQPGSPVVFPGNTLTVITVACTGAAFLTYFVYMLGWYWRQGLMDTLKLFTKEDIVPLNADKFLFLLAPILVYVPALLSWIVIPFGAAIIGGHYCFYVVQDLNVGLLLIIADFSLFLVAVIMSGYASNNKYALVGAMREAAMLLTYEVPMLMSLLCVALFAGSLNLVEIVQRQSMTWGIVPLFPAFVIFLVCSLADTNRPPFDLPEAQNELLGGYLVEYSGLRFALFYVAEYSNLFITCAVMTTCFLGGWKGPMFLGPDGVWLSSLCWFLIKTYALVFFFIWARATMPRIRIDQIMFFSWKFLLPASVVAVALTAVGVVYRHPWFSANQIALTRPVQELGTFTTRYFSFSTWETLKYLTVQERAFFWSLNFFLALFGAFMLWLGWRILYGKRRHPLPRREVTWS